MKTIIDLSASEARKFFLQESSYCNFLLPEYFTFQELLQSVDKNISDTRPYQFDKNYREKSFRLEEGVCYKLLNNKDGEFTWRKLQLIHPVLYVFLVKIITQEDHWNTLRLSLQKKREFIQCASLPIVAAGWKQRTSRQISAWRKNMEQESIKMAIRYQYIFHTDISNFYDSIYTHTISWAVHGKPTSKKKHPRNTNLIGMIIDTYLIKCSCGQTNGIPQGSVLMDFIAEILLSYVDCELEKKLSAPMPVLDCKIIRYRDDYRIFVVRAEDGRLILKLLSEVLSDVGLSTNSAKTFFSDNIPGSSLKEDKLSDITRGKTFKNIQHELLTINELSRTFPNSGTIDRRLEVLGHRVENWKKFPNPEVLAGILTEIAYKNPRTYPQFCTLLSLIMRDSIGEKARWKMVEDIRKKFELIPNTDYLDIFLQRITKKLKGSSITFNAPLCKIVDGEKVQIWNSDWLKGDFSDLKKIVDETPIVDQNKLEKMESFIAPKETALFDSY